MSTVPNSVCGSEVQALNLASPSSSHSSHIFAHTPNCRADGPRPSTEESSNSRDKSQQPCDQEPAAQGSDEPVSGGSVSSANERNGNLLNADRACDASPRHAAGKEKVEGSKNGFSCRESLPQSKKLHRIAEVRKSQGLSERSACKRLDIDIATLRELEDPTSDLTLSQLLKVQSVLEVPLVDLVEDSNSLARPIQERAKLVRIMKTVAAIEESVLANRPKRLVEMLREQLVDLMPELTSVGSWPQFGSRRGSASIARVLEREINMSQLSSE